MNKITMNNNIMKQKNIVQEKVDLVITSDTKITIFNNEISNLNLKVMPNTKLIVNDFRIIKKEKTKIKITAEDNAHITYNHAFINQGDYDLDIKLDMVGNNSYLLLNVHGITDAGNTNINIDGKIGKTNLNNEFLEKVHLININQGKAKCVPNILIANKEVVANHEVSIGKLNDNELEYLMSKGITKGSAKKLILNGFLIDIINDKKLKIKIKEILN